VALSQGIRKIITACKIKVLEKNIGAYLIGFDVISVDHGTETGVARSADGKNWSTDGMRAGYMFTGSTRSYITAAANGSVDMRGTAFDIPVTIISNLIKDRLPTSAENLAVDGSATFQVTYL
jgi:hypothetical protein